jgi:hypothetical protein
MRKFTIVVLSLALAMGLYAQSEADFEIEENPDKKTVAIKEYKGTAKDVIIPAKIYNRDVTLIKEGAFAAKDLTGVTIPDGTKIIMITQNAFKDNRIGRLTLGRGIQAIGDNAFANNRLTTIVLPNTLKSIGAKAFANNQILSLTIPQGVTVVASGAFAENPIVAVNIPQSLARRVFDATRGSTLGFSDGVFAPNTTFGSNIVGVTVPGGMDEMALRGNFPDDFVMYWIGQSRRAGAYIKQGPLWNVVAVAARDSYIQSQINIRAAEVEKLAEERAKKEAEERAKKEAEEKAAAEAEAKRVATEAAAQKKLEDDRFSSALKSSGFTANILPDGSIEITGYNVKGASITVPAVIGGKTVTRIAENAFREKISKGEIKTVSLPATVTEIGRFAFANMTGTTATGKKGKSKLESISWGAGLKKVEDYAFSENSTLLTIRAGTSRMETDLPLNAVSQEFFLAWSASDRGKTYTKKGSRWE